MLNIINDFLSETDINYILSLSKVIEAKQNIDSKMNGSVYFSITLTPTIKKTIFDNFGLSLDTVPMRWIKGDTMPHIDNGSKQFQKTHLVYLTDSSGKFIIEKESYPITKGSAFIFDEGLNHETVNTGLEPRLLLGPMSEEGLAVGSGISINGGTIIYIRQLIPTPGSTIEYSINNKVTWFTAGFNFNISNITPVDGVVQVIFTTDLYLNNTSDYFGCNSGDIQFGSTSLNPDGTRPTIYISTVDYPGLIFNGSSVSDGYNNISIYNLIINGTDGTQYTGAGWFGYNSYFGKNSTGNYIINCSSIGNIKGGGILGDNAENVTLIGCSSFGIIQEGAGGIVGQYANSINIESCWSEGSISGDGAGGIVGALSESVEVTNCYSIGNISGNNTGGIVGSNAGSILTTISNCYSKGAITGANAGGICGSLAPSTGYTYSVTITNCYSSGNLNNTVPNNNGGICGPLTPYSINPPIDPSGIVILTLTNCYTCGTVNISNGYIIAGYNTIPLTCYSEADNGSSGWKDFNANTVLTGYPSLGSNLGTTWISIGSNLPYILSNMGYNPYSATNISGTNLIRTSTSTLNAGNSSNAGIKPAFYAILKILGGDSGSITINPGNGVISTTSSTVPATYTLYLYNSGSYNITTFTLIVTQALPPTPTPSSFPVQRISLNQKSSFCGTRAVSSTAVGIGAIRGKGSATRIFNNCINKNVNFQLCQYRCLGYK